MYTKYYKLQVFFLCIGGVAACSLLSLALSP